jgi:hypothetical protein
VLIAKHISHGRALPPCAEVGSDLTLLWCEDLEIPGRKFRDERGQVHEDEIEEDALPLELDGQLRWLGKRRRR